jgi:hypothetical protein
MAIDIREDKNTTSGIFEPEEIIEANNAAGMRDNLLAQAGGSVIWVAKGGNRVRGRERGVRFQL